MDKMSISLRSGLMRNTHVESESVDPQFSIRTFYASPYQQLYQKTVLFRRCYRHWRNHIWMWTLFKWRIGYVFANHTYLYNLKKYSTETSAKAVFMKRVVGSVAKGATYCRGQKKNEGPGESPHDNPHSWLPNWLTINPTDILTQ